jgi:hypothetical protein
VINQGAIMKMGFFVSLAAALALMVAIPADASARDGKLCGGFGDIKCSAGQFCQYPTGTCGRLDRMGTCTPVPRFCPLVKTRVVLEVCGCNFQTYNNGCERQRAMVSELHPGKC